MTGADALAYLQRRLSEYGMAVEDGRTDELYDYLSEGRDTVLRTFADAAPLVVQQTVVLVPDATDTRQYAFPAATADPLRVLRVYDDGTGEDLEPASELNFDVGHYAWDDIRTLHLADSIDVVGNVAVKAVLGGPAITKDTADSRAAWGLPTTCHRAAAKFAAVLALTADESNNAQLAQTLFAQEIDQLSRLYGDFDSASGLALRNAFLKSMGDNFGDSLY